MTRSASQQRVSEIVQLSLNSTTLDFDELNDKNYQTILKIILTPSENFIDKLREKLLECDDQNETFFSDCLDYFFFKKNQLTQTIKNSEKFNKWFERLLPMELDSLLLGYLKKPLYVFSIDIVREKIEKNFLILDELIQLSAEEPLLKLENRHSIGIYTPLIALRDTLLNLCVPFFEKSGCAEVDIKTFVLALTSLSMGFQSLSLTPVYRKNKVNFLLIEIDKAMNLLQRCFYFFENDFEEIQRAEVEPIFQPVLALNICELVGNTFVWLKKSNDLTNTPLVNKNFIVHFFEKIYCTREVSESTVSSRVFSAVLSASSFFSKPKKTASAPVFSRVDFADDIADIKEKLIESETSLELLAVINRLLLLAVLRDLHHQFITGLISQCWRECVVRPMVSHLQYESQGTHLKAYFKANGSYPELNNAVNLMMLQMYTAQEEPAPLQVTHTRL